MNKRIRQLSDQAELTIRDSRGNTYMSHPEFNKKFAELIVRECANVANSGIDPAESHLIGNDILEHFGVEE